MAFGQGRDGRSGKADLQHRLGLHVDQQHPMVWKEDCVLSQLAASGWEGRIGRKAACLDLSDVGLAISLHEKIQTNREGHRLVVNLHRAFEGDLPFQHDKPLSLQDGFGGAFSLLRNGIPAPTCPTGLLPGQDESKHEAEHKQEKRGDGDEQEKGGVHGPCQEGR